MNVKQLIVLWVGVVLFGLSGLWPPSLGVGSAEGQESSWVEFKFILSSNVNVVIWQNLLAEWIVVAVLTAAAIYTLRDIQ